MLSFIIYTTKAVLHIDKTGHVEVKLLLANMHVEAADDNAASRVLRALSGFLESWILVLWIERTDALHDQFCAV